MSQKTGIEKQTLRVAMVPLLLLALLLQGYFIFVRFADLDHTLFERGKLIAHQLVTSSEYAVFSGNRALLQQQVDAAYAQPDVNAITVMDRHGHILVKAGESSQMLPAGRSYAEDGKRLWISKAIVPTQIHLEDVAGETDAAAVEPVGKVVIEMSKQHLNQEKLEMLLFNLVLTLLVLAVTTLIVMRVARRITDPIVSMNQGILKIGHGDLSTRIEVKSEVTELEELAAGLNKMAEQLQMDRSTLQQRIEEATRELRQKKEEAEKANFDKTRFLAAASHDLRQPMHAMGLFVGELQQVLETDEQRKIAGKVEESVAALSGLLDSLLDISKLDAGVVVPQIQPVALAGILEHIAQDFGPMAAVKGLVLRVRPCRHAVYSDPVLLERILINLVSNAIRYTPRGGAILLACRKRGDALRLEVRDSGVGIPPHELHNVFREFVQLSNPERDRSKGLGLGLAIVDRLAKLLHHPLSVDSALGKGSTFALYLPPAPSHESADDSLAPAAQLQLKEMGAKRVLVVDDDVLVRTSTVGILASWGCEVIDAGSFTEVLEKYRTTPIDLLVCDYRLPDGNGMQLADLLTAQGRQCLPVILISGDTSPDVLKKVSERGHHLLHKPVRPAKLRSLVQHLLGIEV